MRTLFNFPGKLGDLLYTIPVIRAYQAQVNSEIDIQTSLYCVSAIPLLQKQFPNSKILVDKSYVSLSTLCGLQPFSLETIEGYDVVYQLGFDRQMIGSPTKHSHLIDAHMATMKIKYNIDIDADKKGEYIFLDRREPNDTVIFSPCGESFFNTVRRGSHYTTILDHLWKSLLSEIDKEVIIVCRKHEEEYCKQFERRMYCAADLLDLTQVIYNARCFIGVQSCPYVIAEGLKSPRFVLGTFKHVLPLGPRGFTINMNINFSEAMIKIKEWLA